MESGMNKYYFVIVKVIGMFAVLFWGMTTLQENSLIMCGVFLGGACYLLCTVMAELSGGNKRYLWLFGEGILAVLAVFLFPVIGIYFCAVAYFDFLRDQKAYFYLGGYFLLLIPYFCGEPLTKYILILSLLILVFLQQHKSIGWYRRVVGESQQTESQLKSDMEHTNRLHMDEIRQSRLMNENSLLEEKARIAQALHDKLGHSINGSLYKLEAAKLLLRKKPEESENILQEVIDNLRGSMDEIRVILRNEKPDKKRMALKSLQALCEECEKEYQIKMHLEVSQEEKEIPEGIWEIILDNTFEAVTNALKYSGCDEITIQIVELGEVVRCIIHDNGKGAEIVEDGMGLQGMKQRVRNVKGFLGIDSMNGFTINMILPIKNGVQNKAEA